ncbi:peptide ABC transporter permease [Candidatus Formimonas warabiya]|uniref:Peptide ABC transporter permease n=2 Tax=Formimonas warabiya TaxID=1761012 RepID=A0A3G1L1Q0_FORW1|nr:peptide ABC transporter permease [Candidatus Formimonas warabiya]
MVLAMFFIVSLTFFLMKALPGGPFAREKKLPAAIERNINEKYHLDDPLFVQYRDYLVRAARFDFGPSFKFQNRTVNEIIFEGFPVSAQLGFVSVCLALVLGLFLGMISALKHNKIQDYLAMVVATLGFSVPSFITACVLMYIFSYQLRWFPAAMWGSWRQMVLPALALSFLPMAAIARLIRSGLIEVLQQDYIKTAKAKGLKKGAIIYRHGLRNAVMPVVTYLGPLVATIFTGSFIIEYIFNIPGLGRYFVTSIQNRDYTMIMGTTVFYSAFLMGMNLLVDILYALIDPRVKLGEEKR